MRRKKPLINYIYQLVSPGIFKVKYKDIDYSGKVLIKPNYMAICHADQRYYQGNRPPEVLKKKLPMAVIHEACGKVVYDDTGTYQVGQNVVMIPNSPRNKDEVILENYEKGSKFLSSGIDGFMREVIDLPVDRVIPFDNIKESTAAITEFISVAVHGATRFDRIAHSRRNKIGIWGDGSLAYTVANVLKVLQPNSKILVIGKNGEKLSQFTFADETYLTDEIPEDIGIDHAFECCGGEGSYYAIEDIIKYINPQGAVILMGVSENRVPIYTRNVLEKGLTMVGCSRSGRADFEKAVACLGRDDFAKRMERIIYIDKDVKNIKDINDVFADDLNTTFKTVFKWNI